MTITVDFHLTDEAAQRLADGLLDEGAQDAGVARHAEGCAACAALVESHRALASALDGLCCPEVPHDFTAGVLERVEAADRQRVRERWLAGAILAGVLVAALAALAAAGAGGVGTAVARWADLLGDATRALRVGREILPTVFAAMRWPLAAATAALAVPLFLLLARLMPQPATRTI
jgi:hypothetical protein